MHRPTSTPSWPTKWPACPWRTPFRWRCTNARNPARAKPWKCRCSRRWWRSRWSSIWADTPSIHRAAAPVMRACSRRTEGRTARAMVSSPCCRAQTRAGCFDELYADLANVVTQRTTQAWLDLLGDADIPHSRILGIPELLDDPHLAATGFFKRVEHPTEGTLVATNVPVRFSRTPGSIRSLAPSQAPNRVQQQEAVGEA